MEGAVLEIAIVALGFAVGHNIHLRFRLWFKNRVIEEMRRGPTEESGASLGGIVLTALVLILAVMHLVQTW